jgi:hypothetical protein
MTLLDQATRRATARKASTPMGAHLDLPSNARQVDKAYKQQQVYQACSKYLQFFEISIKNTTWVEGYGEEILGSGTYKPTTVTEKKIR